MEAQNRKESSIIPFSQGSTALAVQGQDPSGDNLFFVNELRKRIHNVMSSRPSVAEAALCVLSVLQQIVLRESSSVKFEDGLEKLLDSLCAEPLVRRAFSFLYRQSKGVLQSIVSHYDVSDEIALELLKDIERLVEWYGTRSQSIHKASEQESLLERGEEGIFDIEIVHDVERHGVPGLEVTVGMVLDSRAEETVWIKVYPLFRGKPIFAAPGWDSWIDQSGGGEEVSYGDYLCVSVPLSCQGSRAVGKIFVDSAKVFLPYAAFEWPDDVHVKNAEVTIVASVCDQSEEKIFSRSIVEKIRVWNRRGNGVVLPSPQSTELWSQCPIKNNAIRNVHLQSVQSVDGLGIEVAFDASVVGYLAREVFVELRVLDDRQEMMETPYSEVSDERGYYRQEYVLAPSRIFADFDDLQMTVMYKHLPLEEGTAKLFLEITLLDENRKVLCGVLEPIIVRVR